MLPQKELDKAVEIAEKYGVGKLYLLGSALSEEPEKAHDYDFAVDGVPEGVFFKFYGESVHGDAKERRLDRPFRRDE